VKVALHLYLVPRVRMSRAILLLSPYVFMPYTRIKLLITKVGKGKEARYVSSYMTNVEKNAETK
jgi:hypothetical protein